MAEYELHATACQSDVEARQSDPAYGLSNTGQYVDAPFNGADVPVHGPHGSEGLTYSARLAGRYEILISSKHNGKPLDQTSLKLSSDGRVITQSWWDPSRPNDKGTLVYEKQ